MGFLSWALFGLIAGVVARMIVPSSQPGGCVMTAILGVVGAAIGGWIGTQLGWGTVQGFDIRSFGLAILGAIVLLLVLEAIRRR
jgi:uncharacterized membrane protein YeaQ/YmgE (transglycosylase-associated protein family)